MSVEQALSRVVKPFDRPWHWIAFALVFLLLDFFTGPNTAFSITFVLPVAFAAWHRGLRWSLSLSVVMPMALLAIGVAEQPARPLAAAIGNALVWIGVLAIMAFLIDSVSRHVRELHKEVHVLSGLLPICASCKKIRAEDESWQRLEHYISVHSEASFTHSLCPECEARLYPDDETG